MKKTIVTIGVLLGIFLFSLLLRLSTLNEIGRTWDESLYVEQGHKMITLLKKGDVTSVKWGMSGFYAEVLMEGTVRKGDSMKKINLH